MTQRSPYQKYSATGLKILGDVHTYIAESGLPQSLLDLVYLRASQMNGCAYCIDSHTRDSLKGGASVEKVSLVPVFREGGSLFSEMECAALAWTESITAISETRASDSDYAAAAGVLSEKELSDLTLAIGMINVYNRLAIGFRRPPLSARIAERATPAPVPVLSNKE